MELTDKWIAGFVDGDGCFKIYKSKHATSEKEFKRYVFVVSQDQRSVQVLYALKKRFACGSVHKAGGTMYEYRVTNKDHLKNIILPFFLKYPLQTSKIKDFQILYEDLIGTSPSIDLTSICADWLLGFIDAEANFYVSMVKNYPRPQFSIGLNIQDQSILESIKNLMNCGLIYEKRPKKAKAYITYQISDLDGFKKIIQLCTTSKNRCLLKTSKRISFLKFKQVVLIIEKKEHTSLEGILKIKKILKKS